MMNARTELKEVKKALKILRLVGQLPELEGSEMLRRDLSDIIAKYTYRLIDLEDATARKKPKGAS